MATFAQWRRGNLGSASTQYMPLTVLSHEGNSEIAETMEALSHEENSEIMHVWLVWHDARVPRFLPFP